jgi:SPP1 family phage portal protein
MGLILRDYNLQIFIEELKGMGGRVTSAMLSELFNGSLVRREKEKGLYNRYKGTELSILARNLPFRCVGQLEGNNKLSHDFRGDITDQFVGYIFGNGIKYTLKPERYKVGKDDEGFKKDTRFFDYFCDVNSFADIDTETGKRQSICGRGARLCYISDRGKTELGLPDYRVINIDPSECVFVYEASRNELEYAVRYYVIGDVSTSGELRNAVGNYSDKSSSNFSSQTSTQPLRTRLRVEFYDKRNVYFYLSDTEKKTFREEEAIAHGFDFVPLFEVLNNEEGIGDFEKVESLIDAYDRTASDTQNEIEAFRLAYLILTGARLSDEDMRRARDSGIYQLDEGEKLEYLTKIVDSGYIKEYFERTTKNIYRFSKTVDTSSETFTGSGASGETRKWALLSLDNKSTIKINKFKKALQYQFQVLSSAWKKVGISLSWDKIGIQFDRNIPVEMGTEAQFASTLNGIVSKRTIFENLSFIKNADDELSRINDENNKEIDLDDFGKDSDEDSGEGRKEGAEDSG